MAGAMTQTTVKKINDRDNAGDEDIARIIGRLKEAAPFQELPETVLTTIAEISDIRTYADNETIAAMGQFDASEFFLVLAGALKACRVDPESGAMVFEEKPGDSLFGLAEALTGDAQTGVDSISLTAQTDTEILAIDAETFRQIVAQRPTLTRNLMLYFANLVASGALRAVSAEASPEQRVYSALLEFVELAGPAGPWQVEKMPKHRELAERAGVDESLAAQAIATIIQDGVARRNYPGLIVDDIDRLKTLAA